MEGVGKISFQSGSKHKPDLSAPQSRPSSVVVRVPKRDSSDESDSELQVTPVKTRVVTPTTEPVRKAKKPVESSDRLRSSRTKSQQYQSKSQASTSETESHYSSRSSRSRYRHGSAHHEQYSRTRSRSPHHKNRTGAESRHRNDLTIQRLKKTYKRCVDLIKNNKLKEAREQLLSCSDGDPEWSQKVVQWTKDHGLNDEERKQCIELVDIFTGLKFSGGYHSDMESLGRWKGKLPDPHRRGFPWEHLGTGLVFTDSLLLNPVFRDDENAERDKLSMANDHLQWVLDSRALEEGLHVKWLESYMDYCDQQTQLNKKFLNSEEGKAYSKTLSVIGAMKEKKDPHQALNVLNEHMAWVRQQECSPLALRSLACCARRFTSHYIHSMARVERDQTLQEQSNVYFYASKMLVLGSRRLKFPFLLGTLEKVGELAIPLENYPAIMSDLILDQYKVTSEPGNHHRELRWGKVQTEQLRAVFAKNCAAVLSLNYVGALRCIANKEYSQAISMIDEDLTLRSASQSQRARSVTQEDVISGEENNALYLLKAYCYYLDNRNNDAIRCLDECHFRRRTQTELQVMRLYKKLECPQKVENLLAKSQPASNRIMSSAYQPIVEWLKKKPPLRGEPLTSEPVVPVTEGEPAEGRLEPLREETPDVEMVSVVDRSCQTVPPQSEDFGCQVVLTGLTLEKTRKQIKAQQEMLTELQEKERALESAQKKADQLQDEMDALNIEHQQVLERHKKTLNGYQQQLDQHSQLAEQQKTVAIKAEQEARERQQYIDNLRQGLDDSDKRMEALLTQSQALQGANEQLNTKVAGFEQNILWAKQAHEASVEMHKLIQADQKRENEKLAEEVSRLKVQLAYAEENQRKAIEEEKARGEVEREQQNSHHLQVQLEMELEKTLLETKVEQLKAELEQREDYLSSVVEAMEEQNLLLGRTGVLNVFGPSPFTPAPMSHSQSAMTEPPPTNSSVTQSTEGGYEYRSYPTPQFQPPGGSS